MANPNVYACDNRAFVDDFCGKLAEMERQTDLLNAAIGRYSAMQRPNYAHAGDLGHAIEVLRELNRFLSGPKN